ncbi:uncharacterized protein LOC124265368 isoform X2 [Haliotis rubra]|uniref:uncharacterized protein LOC124265368 isoform X2 n=1 Tax=Haliotis rubra TaxID=36100 RepID=UPI001EE59B80|nr:uncharacterized protein LOC124265368 isoform X2 [Haliotis rubra]
MTQLWQHKLQRGTEVPRGFHSNVFTTLVCDNNDFGEETLSGYHQADSGKGTAHNTKGVIIQRSETDVTAVSMETSSVQRDRKRTIDSHLEEISQYYGSKRTGPVQFKGQNQELEGRPEVQEPFKSIDQSLHFAKFIQTDDPLPGWTGCNQLLQSDAKAPSKIGHLPVIDASPTDKSTVNAILERSLSIADKLNLQCVAVVMDQAIYAKAQEIRWQG